MVPDPRRARVIKSAPHSAINRPLFNEARDALSISNQDLADLIGVHKSSLAQWLSGERSPSAAHVAALAEALNIRPWTRLLNPAFTPPNR